MAECEVLIRAVDDLTGRMPKGSPVTVRNLPLPGTWGAKEGLPNHVILKITGASAFEVNHWMSIWEIRFVHVVLVDTSTLLKLQFEVAQTSISASGRGRNEVKAEAQTWATRLGGTVQALTAFSIIVDFPKPADAATLERLFNDKFAREEEATGFYFSDADIDAAVIAGGRFEKTKAEALALVRNKLDD